MAVDPPDAEGAVVDQGVFGEQLTALVLADAVPPEVARDAAAGWTGDSYVTWQAGGAGTCIRIHYVLGSMNEAQQLFDAYNTWARPRGGASVDEGARGKPEFLVTSCGGAASGRSPL